MLLGFPARGPPDEDPSAAGASSGSASTFRLKEETSFMTHVLEKVWDHVLGSLRTPSLLFQDFIYLFEREDGKGGAGGEGEPQAQPHPVQARGAPSHRPTITT